MNIDENTGTYSLYIIKNINIIEYTLTNKMCLYTTCGNIKL